MRYPYTSEVISVNKLSNQYAVLKIQKPENPAFVYEAGQYLHLCIAGFEPRPFSIANGNTSSYLEFHIENRSGGTGEYVFEKLKPGDIIGFDGPHGNAVYHSNCELPVIGIGGGTGIAPLKAIVDEYIAKSGEQKFSLYHGSVYDDGLYMHDYFRKLASDKNTFAYKGVYEEQRVKSDPACETMVKGRLDRAVLKDCPDLSGYRVYIFGSKGMVKGIVQIFMVHGMNPACLHTDCPLNELETELKVQSKYAT